MTISTWLKPVLTGENMSPQNAHIVTDECHIFSFWISGHIPSSRRVRNSHSDWCHHRESVLPGERRSAEPLQSTGPWEALGRGDGLDPGPGSGGAGDHRTGTGSDQSRKARPPSGLKWVSALLLTGQGGTNQNSLPEHFRLLLLAQWARLDYLWEKSGRSQHNPLGCDPVWCVDRSDLCTSCSPRGLWWLLTAHGMRCCTSGRFVDHIVCQARKERSKSQITHVHIKRLDLHQTEGVPTIYRSLKWLPDLF